MQTRLAAVAEAEILLKDGAKANFKPISYDPPEDQGDPNVWMEVENVKVHDNYYEIDIKSDLGSLTGIDASLEVPDQYVSSYLSFGVTRDDGSIHLHMPRLEDKEYEKEAIIEVIA